jgi:hypothetical protein
MKSNFLEYIILYLLVACVALIVATLARISAISFGADGFTAFVVFVIALSVCAAIYLSIRVFLQELMLPWIEKGLNKIPFFRDKKKTASNPLDMEEIRNTDAVEKEKMLAFAQQYTQKTFASFAADEDVLRLCDYIGLFANKQNLNGLKPIKINDQLSSFDLYHFGWNIWNYFRIRKQDDIALFLKLAFSHTLRDVGVETIKKHLKDDERKGIIKISENIVE